MATMTKMAVAKATEAQNAVGLFIGKMFSFNTGLKLYHWQITGKGSYAQHIALDQAIGSLLETIDSLTETSIALYGELPIEIPATKTPKDIIAYCEDFYKVVDAQYKVFEENFSQALLDDVAEAVQQLLYRLKRLQ